MQIALRLRLFRYSTYKPVEAVLTVGVVLEHRGGVEYLFAGDVDVVRDGFRRLFLFHIRAAVRDKLRNHTEVFVERMAFFRKRLEIEGSASRQDVLYLFALALQPSGEDEQPLNFYDAYRFLFDVVKFCGGMEDAEGMFLVRAVVAEDEAYLIFAVVVEARNGRDRVVGSEGAVFVLRSANDVCAFVGVVFPRGAEHFSRAEQLRAVFAFQPDDGVVPFRNGNVDVGEVLHQVVSARARAEDGQDFLAALIVVVRENGAAHDGKSGVGAYEIAGEEVHEVEHTAESRRGDVHRTVFARYGDDAPERDTFRRSALHPVYDDAVRARHAVFGRGRSVPFFAARVADRSFFRETAACVHRRAQNRRRIPAADAAHRFGDVCRVRKSDVLRIFPAHCGDYPCRAAAAAVHSGVRNIHRCSDDLLLPDSLHRSWYR